VHDTPATGATRVCGRFATPQLTWDILGSRDLYSWLRMRGGLGLERTYTDLANRDRSAVTPAVALDGNVTLDAARLQPPRRCPRLRAPRTYDAPAAAGKYSQRVKGGASATSRSSSPPTTISA